MSAGGRRCTSPVSPSTMIGVARLGQRHDVVELADGGDAERARHDRDVAGRPDLLQHQPAQPLAVVVEQLRRPHVARDDDGVLRQIRGEGPVRAAHQLAQQPVGEVVEIVQPVAQERIGLPRHLRARVVLHALDRRLGREAVADRLLQPPRPAAILGEHLVGFENLAVLAGAVPRRRAPEGRRPRVSGSPSPRRGGGARCSTSSAMSSVTTTRGSCSTTWPSAIPSA